MNYYMHQKGFASIFLVVAIAAIVVIGGYYLIPKNSLENSPAPTSNSSVPTTPSTATVIEIKTGTSFGECVGYCKAELAINSKRIVFTKNSWDPSYPEIKKERPILSDKWSSLIDILDLEKFLLLPETIGCPDCADGGAEWIEIFDGSTTKRVTFEYGASVPGIDPFVKKMREIRGSIPENNDPAV